MEQVAKVGRSLNDPKPLVAYSYFVSNPQLISLAASSSSNNLRLHYIIVSKIRPHFWLTHLFLSRNVSLSTSPCILFLPLPGMCLSLSLCVPFF